MVSLVPETFTVSRMRSTAQTRIQEQTVGSPTLSPQTISRASVWTHLTTMNWVLNGNPWWWGEWWEREEVWMCQRLMRSRSVWKPVCWSWHFDIGTRRSITPISKHIKGKIYKKKIQLRITHQVICPSDGLSWPWSDKISVPNSSFSPLRGGSGARLARGQSEGHLERCPGYEPCARDTSLVPEEESLSLQTRAADFTRHLHLLIIKDGCPGLARPLTYFLFPLNL